MLEIQGNSEKMKAPRTLKAPKFSHSTLETAKHTFPATSSFIIGVPGSVIAIEKQQRSRTRYKSPKLKLATTFKQELEKLGADALQIIPRNPSKDLCGLSDIKGLPFQRRARSHSPPRASLRPMTEPLVIPRPVQAINRTDDFSGLLDASAKDELDVDEDLERMKRDYLALLDQVDANLSTKNTSPKEEGGESEETLGCAWSKLLDRNQT